MHNIFNTFIISFGDNPKKPPLGGGLSLSPLWSAHDRLS